MKKYLYFSLLFLIFSCKNVSESDLELNVDPLTKAFKKNNVEYYIRYVSGKDTIYTIDSVCINKNGLITLNKVKKGWASETSYEYDSLNRIVKTEHKSDINYINQVEYKLEKKTGNLICSLKNSKELKSYEYYEFCKGKLIKRFVYNGETKDTVNIILYKYNTKNKIIEISKNNLSDKYIEKTKYNFRPNNTLKEIIEENEVKYISERTGLIDSVKQRNINEKITYKYYFRKK